jgi:ATP-dependent RNA helicase DeaD
MPVGILKKEWAISYTKGVFMTFKELGLNPEIIEAISAKGFVNPTPIQQQIIPLLLAGERDCIGLAQTGTGKTAAFGLPLIHGLDLSRKITQALILCPTRELCLQITTELQSYAATSIGVNVVPVYGGTDIRQQIRALKQGAQIVVGTPGRMLDHIGRGTISLSNVQVVVLDEADEMLNMGFQQDIDAILKELPETKRTWLFSATMPQEVERIVHRYMKNPLTVMAGEKNRSASLINHFYCVVSSEHGYAALRRFIDLYPGLFGIIFCRTKREVQDVAHKLMRDGYDADALHGDLSQAQRDAVMQKFRTRKISLLVATDVAARGIDVNDITHVIHYHLPDDIENYIHRSGRTARAGKSGMSLAIVHTREASRISYLERRAGIMVDYAKVPSNQQICQAQLKHFINAIQQEDISANTSLDQFMPLVATALENLSKEELIKKLLMRACQSLLTTYGADKEVNLDAPLRSTRSDRSGDYADNGNSSRGSKLYINLGRIDGFDKGRMAQYIAQQAQINSGAMGTVIIGDKSSFIGIGDTETGQKIIDAFNDAKYNGRTIRVEFSTGGRSSGGPRRRPSSGGGYHRGERRGGGDRSHGRQQNWSRA